MKINDEKFLTFLYEVTFETLKIHGAVGGDTAVVFKIFE